jgi:hypothetical protein
MKHLKFVFLSIGVIFSLGACSSLLPGPQVDGVATQVQQTLVALQTQSAFETLIAPSQPNNLTQLPTNPMVPTETPWVITATPLPTTATLPPTETMLPPTPTLTHTPVASSTPMRTPTPLPTAVPCNWLQFVTDVTIPDGTTVQSGQTFVKTWRIRNAGSCEWTSGYALVFADGEAMGGPASVILTTPVAPGNTVDLSVTLTAPLQPGSYKGNWKMRTAAGAIFGGGATADKPFWVQITVPALPTPNPQRPFVLSDNYCAAEWRTNVGIITCPQQEGASGSVVRVTNPKLEGGYQDDEPAIVVMPASGDAGMIQGKFPPFVVKTGDRFRLVAGCMDQSPNCNALLQINYSIGGGAVQNLATWTETSDGNFYRADIDLSSFNGQSVQFYLVVYNNSNSTDDRIFWLLPHVYRPTP